ncbi:threonine synthase-like 1 [Latimeria chalumnae]|uniref:Threonine synthase like 1 n=1 Tax=Latimeria chalumnae TaxID=7897 RepID=H2ZXH3_LATCH|nr:PREDICTED: threonine synthase-like 1 [Latimeria chalumnae]|eukprot:XP_006010388.1 PREDICTED: threonine synthase-like 1 [Latimeria chalumnae]
MNQTFTCVPQRTITKIYFSTLCFKAGKKAMKLPFLRILTFLKLGKLQMSTRSSLFRQKNIVLMGPPGAGKTVVGRVLGHKLGLPVIDVDDVLEKTWNVSVSKKLEDLGREGFLEEEGKVLLNFSSSGSVISLSGSNPMHSASMQHVKNNGIIIYLDVPTDDIIGRLEQMKVDRIIGQGPTVSVREILQYTKQFYKKWHDARILCEVGDTVEKIADKVIGAVKRYQDSETETFISTRNVPENCESNGNKTFFSDVVVEGLALDGGLYVPMNGLPKLTYGEWQRLVDASYVERAQLLLERCIHPNDIPVTKLQKMVETAYGENFDCMKIAPVKYLMDNQFLLELYHGPTASFKDLALQLMPNIFAYCIPKTCNYLVLVATSGDTGSAVMDGFSRLSDIDKQRIAVLTFYPEEGISQIQKVQMIGYQGENVWAVGIKSDFDFCQKAVKEMFTKPDYTGFLAAEYATALSAANSINWACLLPQVVYHASAYLDLINQGVITFGSPVDVCIPTGNFGNILAAVYAKLMGIPIRRFICASSHNSVLTDFIRTGQYDVRNRKMKISSSLAIGILKSSNLERYLHLISNSNGQLVKKCFFQLENEGCFQLPRALLEKMQEDFVADWCPEEECLATIHSVYRATGYILDTHTAVAKVVTDRMHDKTCPVIISSTAHYAKFAPAVLQALKVAEINCNPLDQLQLLNTLNPLPPVHLTLLETLKKAKMHKSQVCAADLSTLMDHAENVLQQKFMKVW